MEGETIPVHQLELGDSLPPVLEPCLFSASSSQKLTSVGMCLCLPIYTHQLPVGRVVIETTLFMTDAQKIPSNEAFYPLKNQVGAELPWVKAGYLCPRCTLMPPGK